MKKFLSCVMCLVMIFCTSISAAAVQTEDTPSRESISVEPSGSIDYDAFVKNNVIPKYGSANTSDMKRMISTSNFNNNYSQLKKWAKRTGVLGYDVVDMNSDGLDDLIVYVLYEKNYEGESDSSCIGFQYYTVNTKGELVRSNGYYVFTERPGLLNYCVGGIVKANGRNYLLFETYQKSTFFSNGEQVQYFVYETSDMGVLYQKYFIGQSSAGSSGLKYYLREYNSNHKNVASQLVWSEFNANGKTKIQGLQTAFSKIGFPTVDKVTGNVFDSLGFKNYNYTNSSTNYTAFSCNTNYPTYYFDKSFTRSCYMINAPTDSLYKSSYGSSHSYEFTSTVKHFNLLPAPEVVPNKPKAGTRYGDVDGDDKITSSDSLLVLRASVKLENFDSKLTKLSDVDKDGVISSSDALDILRYSVGLSNNKLINQKV